MVNIRFQKLTIGSIHDSSGVFSGDNVQLYWRHFQKTNEGFGSISGDDNPLRGNVSVILDNDVWDWQQGKKGGQGVGARIL